MKLVTKGEWDQMEPRAQGYVLYMQSAHPGSELADVENPYGHGSRSYYLFLAGERMAVLEAQDGEE